jgi:hypothetical protein
MFKCVCSNKLKIYTRPLTSTIHQVTALMWNPRHPDLFAAGYGSYAFEHQGGGGMVACFSLKDTATPQYTFTMGGSVCLYLFIYLFIAQGSDDCGLTWGLHLIFIFTHHQ